MRVVTNSKLIENRVSWAKRVSFAGMGCLIIGLGVNFYSFNRPELGTAALVLLLIGMVAAVISSNLANSWLREPRADQYLSDVLKRFGNDYVLFNYTVGTTNILLTPTRLYVIAVRNQDDEILINGQTFRQKFRWFHLLRFFSADGLGSPVSDTQKGIKKLTELLEADWGDETIPDIQPLVAFSNPTATINATDPAVPIVHDREIRDYLKRHNNQNRISATQRDRLIAIIGAGNPEQPRQKESSSTTERPTPRKKKKSKSSRKRSR